VKAAKKKLSKNQRRCSELDILIKRLYEDKIFGLLSEKRFGILSKEYEGEQEELEKSSAELKTEIDESTADNLNIDQFIGLAKKYTEFTELTTPMLYDFIDKIIIHERDKKELSGMAQRIDIHLNFVGMINGVLK
jgi:hypothetical protein